MKHRWSTPEFKDSQRRVGLKRAKRSKGSRVKRRARRRLSHSLGRAGRQVELTAPPALDVFDHGEDTIGFVTSVHQALGRSGAKVRLDLSNVTSVTSDALVFLKAAIQDRPHSTVGGNLPKDPVIAEKFIASGFFKGFERAPGARAKAMGLMVRKSDRQVLSELAADLAQFALDNSSITAASAAAASKALIELMKNTFRHASASTPGEERWMAGVYCEDGRATFTFVDLGIGILKSLGPRRHLKLLGLTLSGFGPGRLLADVFLGKVAASQKLAGHGFGLTWVRAMAETGLLADLRVATHFVAGRVSDVAFRDVSARFPGTIYRWRGQSEP